jgi:hypothetical protein
MKDGVLRVVPELEGIKEILYAGEGEDARSYISVVFEKGKGEAAVEAIYLFMESEIEFEKGTIDRQGNYVLLLSVRRLNPWE